MFLYKPIVSFLDLNCEKGGLGKSKLFRRAAPIVRSIIEYLSACNEGMNIVIYRLARATVIASETQRMNS